jgi:hypothetical protein
LIDPNITLSSFRKHPQMLLRWLFHRATRAWRGWPGFLIVGVQKGGTTSLFDYLSQHPNISPPFRKEIKFFDYNHRFGMKWYQANFPLRMKLSKNQSITGEASPNYIFHPNGLARIALTFPDIKIILLLRNPINRAYSHYRRMFVSKRESLTFDEAISMEEERLRGEALKIAANPRYSQEKYFNYSYLSRGRYIEQVGKLFELFPRENVLLLKSEDFYTETARIYHQTLSFLGLPGIDLPNYRVSNQGRYEPMNAATRQKLADYFAPYNERLYQCIQRNFGWE